MYNFHNMKKTFLTCAAALSLLVAPTTTTMAQNADNPFLKPYNTKYDIPPFEKIKTGDFIPAIKAGIEEQKQNLFAITANRQHNPPARKPFPHPGAGGRSVLPLRRRAVHA